MRKYTQKELRNMVALNMAEDISYASDEKHDEIIEKEGFLSQVGYSSGVYGCNGLLFQGHNSGTYYAITSRTSAIYTFG